MDLLKLEWQQEDSTSIQSPSKRIICRPLFTVCLGIFVILFLSLSIVLTIILMQHISSPSLINVNKKERINSSENICLTPDCILTASTLIDAIDTSIDPCDDFYDFMCGRYIWGNPVPDQKLSVSVYYQYNDFYTHQLREIIDNIDDNVSSTVLGRSKEAYHVCLNTSQYPEKELNAFKEFVNTDLGGWPFALGDKWKPQESLEEFLGKMQRFGFIMPFAAFSVETDSFSPQKKIIVLRPKSEPSSLNSESVHFLNSQGETTPTEITRKQLLIKAYTKFIKSTAELLEAENMTSAENMMKEMMALQLTINKVNAISTDDDYEDDGSSNDEYEDNDEDNNSTDTEYGDWNNSSEISDETITLREMNQLANGKIDWIKILNAMFEGIYVFNENDSVLADEAYVGNISEVLSNTTHRSIANYLIWHMITQLLQHAGPKAEHIFYEYMSTVSETYRKPFRWVVCTGWIESAYPFAMTRLFVDDFVDPQGKKTVEEMIHLVRKAYKKIIRESLWLDQETKRRALKKAKSMKNFIGYPDFILDDEKLEKYYEYIPQVYDVHFENYIEIKLNTTLTNLREYEFPPTIYKWDINPIKINAEYMVTSNSIWFPTGILQLPFFDSTRPAAVNFGMIGSIIGHEIGHGFDDTGKDYDEIGRFREWWTKDTLKKYEKRVNCFIDQYNNYCLDDVPGFDNKTTLCVDGKQTLGENIADNTGLIASYKAYEMWVKKYGKESRLPGLEKYSLKQIFFMSYAYTWCENVPNKNWLMLYKTDEHSPSKYRVIGSLANSEEFNEAFNCPVGRMNRGETKCRLW